MHPMMYYMMQGGDDQFTKMLGEKILGKFFDNKDLFSDEDLADIQKAYKDSLKSRVVKEFAWHNDSKIYDTAKLMAKKLSSEQSSDDLAADILSDPEGIVALKSELHKKVKERVSNFFYDAAFMTKMLTELSAKLLTAEDLKQIMAEQSKIRAAEVALEHDKVRLKIEQAKAKGKTVKAR